MTGTIHQSSLEIMRNGDAARLRIAVAHCRVSVDDGADDRTASAADRGTAQRGATRHRGGGSDQDERQYDFLRG